MANKLKVQEQQTVIHLAKQGWGIRKIARELGISRNTVRGYVRALDLEDPDALAQRILESGSASVGDSKAHGNQTDLAVPRHLHARRIDGRMNVRGKTKSWRKSEKYANSKLRNGILISKRS